MRYITGTNIAEQMPSAVTLGNFDGVHIGHRKLIQTMKESAENAKMQSVVFSFSPHPSFLLGNKKPVGLILSPREKKQRIKELGVDVYIEYPFTEQFAEISAERFIREVLVEKLQCKKVIVGKNSRFGKEQEGDAAYLLDKGMEMGFEVISVDPVIADGEIVSSTRIREQIEKADLENANRLLGVPYGVIGTVVEGKKLGREIGFPTANMLADDGRLLPPNGVYITETIWRGNPYRSATSIGYNPTVNGNTKTIETYILHFQHWIYGEPIEVRFLKWLRPEEKYGSLQQLIEAIQMDVRHAEAF